MVHACLLQFLPQGSYGMIKYSKARGAMYVQISRGVLVDATLLMMRIKYQLKVTYRYQYDYHAVFYYI